MYTQVIYIRLKFSKKTYIYCILFIEIPKEFGEFGYYEFRDN